MTYNTCFCVMSIRTHTYISIYKVVSFVMKLVSRCILRKNRMTTSISFYCTTVNNPVWYIWDEHPLTLNNIRLTSGYYSWKLEFSIPHNRPLVPTVYLFQINVHPRQTYQNLRDYFIKTEYSIYSFFK